MADHDDIDRAVRELCRAVESRMLEGIDRKRKRELRRISKELELAKGTELELLSRTVAKKPELSQQFENLIGKALLLHAMNTRAGFVLASVVAREGGSPSDFLADLIARAAADFKQPEPKRTKRKKKQQNPKPPAEG